MPPRGRWCSRTVGGSQRDECEQTDRKAYRRQQAIVAQISGPVHQRMLEIFPDLVILATEVEGALVARQVINGLPPAKNEADGAVLIFSAP